MQKAAKTKIDQEYLSIPGFAQMIGVSERKAWDLVNDPADPVPSYRIGSKLRRIKKSEAHDWMKKRQEDKGKVDQLVNETLAGMTSSKRGRR